MQYNFSDPEPRILKGPNGFLQGYNAQIAVDPVLQLIPPGLLAGKNKRVGALRFPLLERIPGRNPPHTGVLTAIGDECGAQALRGAPWERQKIILSGGTYSIVL